MAFTNIERARIAKVAKDLPPSEEVIAMVRDYMSRTDLSAAEFGGRVGYKGTSLNLFLQGRYTEVASNDVKMREACIEEMRRKPIGPRIREQRGRVFETENLRRIRAGLAAAADRGQVVLLYGAPGTQKTFALETLIAERNRDGRANAVYVYASVRMTILALAKRLGREIGVRLGYRSKERIIQNIIDAFQSGAVKQTAIVIDEAQHLDIDSLEIIRELHDQAGCGVVLAGSHDLFERFMSQKKYLEQWLSRIDLKDPLPGLREHEVRAIVETELGETLTEKKFNVWLAGCRVDDFFARGADRKPEPHKYYSVRRLVKAIEQARAQVRPAKSLAEEVA